MRPASEYGGLAVRCAPGTHEAVAAMLTRRSLATGSVLDLAAGTGALLARLRDAGFTDLHGVELDVPVFGLAGVTPIALDLNTPFAAAFPRQFDVITAVEIIEHLNCPRYFLAEIWKLLEPDGYLILSTPNITHWVGRLSFLLRGELRYFKERDYHHQRHISPINYTHLRLMLKEIGFRVVDFGTAGSFYGPLKRLVAAPAAALFRMLGRTTSGDTIIFLAQKSEPDAASPGRSSAVYTSRHHERSSTPA